MSFLRRLLLVLAALFTATWVVAGEPVLRVVTGNTVLQDIVQVIGGERISATCLLQAGVDPHSYQPVPEDVKRIAAAQLVIINGLGFEGWFAGLAKESGYRGLVVTATRGIEVLSMEDDDHHEDGGAAHGLVDDPHAFNSIAQGVRYAENIRDALINADPAGAGAYQTAATAYITTLRAADAKAKQLFSTIPKAQRKLVTNHDALQYFAKEYGFEIVAPNTALEDSQPSAKDLAEIVAFIRKQGVKSVFLEFGKQEKIVEQIAKEAGVRVGGELYLDGIGPAGSPAASYVGMFTHNVQAIADGLR